MPKKKIFEEKSSIPPQKGNIKSKSVYDKIASDDIDFWSHINKILTSEINQRKIAEADLTKFLRITKVLISSLEKDKLLDNLIQEATALVDAEAGYAGIFFYNRMVTEKYFKNGNPVSFNYSWIKGEGIPGLLLLTKKPYLTNHAENDKHILKENLKQFKIKNLISMPILNSKNQMLGFFEIHNKKGKREFDENDLKKLNAVSRLASITLQNALAFQDLSRAESALQESEERTRLVIESVHDYAIILVDLHGNIASWNIGAEKINGYSAEEIIGKNLRIFYSEADKQIHKPESILKIAKTKGKAVDEGWRIRKDGSKFWALVVMTLLKNKKGKPYGIVKITRDISDRKKAEEDLQKAYDKLEHRVRERTIELEKINENLKTQIKEREKVEKKLESSLKEKELLIKEVHHRVKNNLQIITSLLKLQANYSKNQNVKDLLQESQARVKSMALIHEKLYQSESLTEIDFEDYVRDLTSKLFSSYNYKKNNISSKLEIQKIYFNIDTVVTLGLIINELVTNSLIHAFKNKSNGQIKIKCKSDDKNFYLAVEDNGSGIPAEINFEKTETLGIQLVNTLVEQLSGRISYKCKNGTEFKIVFPK